MQEVARPTIGRVVYVYQPRNRAAATVDAQPKPMAAIVADTAAPMRPMWINVMVINWDGTTGDLRLVPHIAEAVLDGEFYWDWLPYQKGQAAKTEELQAELNKKLEGRIVTEVDRVLDLTSERGKMQASAPSAEDGKR